jgi:hypothetical protein
MMVLNWQCSLPRGILTCSVEKQTTHHADEIHKTIKLWQKITITAVTMTEAMATLPGRIGRMATGTVALPDVIFQSVNLARASMHLST